MTKKISEQFNPEKYMQMAIDAMNGSIEEPRTDGKVCPKVGAVLIKTDGTIEFACRGELRFGDHAEFTLLERKNRSEKLDGSILFATLEPCAPGSRRHPKLGCAERIVNARIKEGWIGIENPDPDVDGKGIKFLQDNGITVHMFYPKFQKTIRELNRKFLKQATERANDRKEQKEVVLSKLENTIPTIAPYLSLTFSRSFESSKTISGNEVLADLNKEEIAGINWIKSIGKTTVIEYALHFGFNEKKSQRHLAKFKAKEFIYLKGRGKNAIYDYVGN